MKSIFLLLVLSGLFFPAQGQTYTLQDSIFNKGDIYIAENILFEFDKAVLTPESILILDTITLFLKRNQNLKVEAGVHTDCRASKAYSRNLSQKRAEAITDYLIQKGIAKERLSAKGYMFEFTPRLIIDSTGKKILLSCEYISSLPRKADQEKAHQLNRRVEFKIIAIKPEK